MAHPSAFWFPLCLALTVAGCVAQEAQTPEPSTPSSNAATGPEVPEGTDGGLETATNASSALAPSASRCELQSTKLKVAVLLVHAGTARVACSVDAVRGTLLDPAQGTPAFYRETSYGLLDLQGDVLGTVDIGPQADCVSRDDARAATASLKSWYAQADLAAAAAGIDLSTYDRRVYVMDRAMNCDNSGGGVARAAFNRAWVFDCGRGSVYAHELGHTLGANHASTPSADNGRPADYGDGSDVMGHGFFQFNGPHRAQMGWLPADRVVTVTSPGTYRIGILESPQPIPQVLVIPRRDAPDQALHLSTRQAVGFDATLGAEFVGHTSIHESPLACPRTASGGEPPKTMLTKTLGDGDTLTNEAAGITITQTTHDDVSATVRITFSDGRQ